MRKKIPVTIGSTNVTLSAMRDGLRHAAACPARSHMECPTFRRLIRAAASGAIGDRRHRQSKKLL